jgi:RHS repeat-associated protein
VTALLPSNQRITWSYDAADQLTLEQKSLPGQTPWATAATFSYDPAGCRTQEQLGERFDSGWNTAAVTYSWDPAERLFGIAHDTGTGSNVTNTYRPDGLRAKKVEGGATQQMIWDGNEVLAQVDASGNLVSYYSRGATLVKQRNAAGSTLTQSYLHLDAQGTVVLRSKEDNSATTGVLDPDPWGGDPGKRWGRVVVDSFTRADANALGTAETGQSWNEASNPTFGITDKFGIRSGQVHVLPSTVNYFFWAWCQSNQSDVRVKVRLTLGTVIGTPPGNGVGILFRADSTGKGLLLTYVGGATNNWKFWKFIGTSYSSLATMTGPQLTQGQTYDLEVRASGSQCTAYVDGVPIGSPQTITDDQTNTYHGLFVFQSTDHLFENFSVLAEADAEPVGWLGDPGYVTEAAVMRRLEYVRARWYQAGGPGWLSKDPIGLRGGDVNLYRYVANRPLVLADPSGFQVGNLLTLCQIGAGTGGTRSAITFVGCSPAQRQRIGAHLRDLCMHRLQWISGGQGLRSCLQKRCGQMRIICRTAKNQFCRGIGIGVPGGGPIDAFTDEPGHPHQTINLCPSAFDSSQAGCLGKILVHEMVHSCLVNENEDPSNQAEHDLYGPGRPPCIE